MPLTKTQHNGSFPKGRRGRCCRRRHLGYALVVVVVAVFVIVDVIVIIIQVVRVVIVRRGGKELGSHEASEFGGSVLSIPPEEEEFIEGSVFDDPTVAEDDDPIGIPDRGQSMGNGEDSSTSPTQDGPKGGSHRGLRRGVEGARCLIEYDDGGILE